MPQPTFIAVHVSILHNHRPAIQGCKLLRLRPALPKIGRRPSCPLGKRRRRRRGSGNADDMAREELLRADEIRVEGLGLAVARGEEQLGRGHEQDVVLDGRALRGESAPEEGPQEGV